MNIYRELTSSNSWKQRRLNLWERSACLQEGKNLSNFSWLLRIIALKECPCTAWMSCPQCRTFPSSLWVQSSWNRWLSQFCQTDVNMCHAQWTTTDSRKYHKFDIYEDVVYKYKEDIIGRADTRKDLCFLSLWGLIFLDAWLFLWYFWPFSIRFALVFYGSIQVKFSVRFCTPYQKTT